MVIQWTSAHLVGRRHVVTQRDRFDRLVDARHDGASHLGRRAARATVRLAAVLREGSLQVGFDLPKNQ